MKEDHVVGLVGASLDEFVVDGGVEGVGGLGSGDLGEVGGIAGAYGLDIGSEGGGMLEELEAGVREKVRDGFACGAGGFDGGCVVGEVGCWGLLGDVWCKVTLGYGALGDDGKE